MDEPLAGHAADVRAGPPVHPLGALDDHDALAAPAHLRRHRLAALAEADDEDVGADLTAGLVHGHPAGAHRKSLRADSSSQRYRCSAGREERDSKMPNSGSLSLPTLSRSTRGRSASRHSVLGTRYRSGESPSPSTATAATRSSAG